MKRSLTVLLLLFSPLCFSNDKHNRNDNIIQQVSTILRFREAVTGTQIPNLGVLYGMFGEDNEIELGLFLSQEFPNLHAGESLSKDNPAVRGFNDYDEHRDNPSRFFICIRKLKRSLFSAELSWYIKVPPKIAGDFTRYDVLIEKERLVFEFSKDGSEIENIYFANGHSIYELTSLCKNK